MSQPNRFSETNEQDFSQSQYVHAHTVLRQGLSVKISENTFTCCHSHSMRHSTSNHIYDYTLNKKMYGWGFLMYWKMQVKRQITECRFKIQLYSRQPLTQEHTKMNCQTVFINHIHLCIQKERLWIINIVLFAKGHLNVHVNCCSVKFRDNVVIHILSGCLVISGSLKGSLLKELCWGFTQMVILPAELGSAGP